MASVILFTDNDKKIQFQDIEGAGLIKITTSLLLKFLPLHTERHKLYSEVCKMK